MADIRKSGGKAEAVVTDVTNAKQIKTLIDKVIQTFGRVDVMINNAGLVSIAPMSELNVAEWNRMIDINVKGVPYGIAAALPVFQSQGSGHFINISSVGSARAGTGVCRTSTR